MHYRVEVEMSLAANPTLTLAALAICLTDHLKSIL
jgi:hypothetical protein